MSSYRIAKALKPNMSVAERNRMIKSVLSEVFGRKNVRVRGGRGSAYGWVDIMIYAKRPDDCYCSENGICNSCVRKCGEIRRKAWQVLEETGLRDELDTYYTDYGEKREKCTIIVYLYD